jgi:hypothetical protein
METQETTHNMKHDFTWILAGLVLIGLLGMEPIGLAAEEIWTKKADMPTGRGELSTCVVDGKIYAIGGSPDFAVAIPTVEEYTPEGWPFQEAVSPHGNAATTWGKIKSDQSMTKIGLANDSR